MVPPDSDDPFPKIQCALLHSGDLLAYAEYGAASDRLFQPFDEGKLKAASYEINLCGTAYWWPVDSSSTEIHSKELDANDTLLIPRNGIVFIRPRVKFKVPAYLALRFNLHIRLVHRGLLLGTGPLVDPGFEGHLLIPVHNLTETPLTLRAEDGFIWIEVTKVSPLTSNPSGYKPFPPDKKDVDPRKYFHRASGGMPIRSSIPSLAKDVQDAKDEIKGHERRAYFASVIAMVGVLVGLGGLVIGSWSIWRDTFDFVKTTRTELTPAVEKQVVLSTDELRSRIASLEREVTALRREIQTKK